MRKPVLVVLLLFFSSFLHAQLTIGTFSPTTATANSMFDLTLDGVGANYTSVTQVTLSNNAAPYNAVVTQNISYMPPDRVIGHFVLSPAVYAGNYDIIATNGLQHPWTCCVNISNPNPNYTSVRVRGKLYHDLDMSGTLTAGDVPASWVVIQATPGSFQTVTNWNGEYDFYVWGASTYTVAPVYSSAFPSSVPVSRTVNAVSPFDFTGQDFPCQNTWSASTVNVGVSYFGVGALRPGFRNDKYAFIRNYSPYPVTMLAGEIALSPLEFHLPSTAPLVYHPYTVSGNTASFSGMTVSPQGYNYMRVADSLPASVPLGTQICYTAQLTSFPLPDQNLTDNSLSRCRLVSNAIDPNDVQVFTAAGQNADGRVSMQDSLLTYVVRFQNTGNDTAIHVYADLTIPTELNLSSFEFLGSTHTCTPVLMGNLFRFRFSNIMLPDSGTNEPGSHGLFAFRLKARQPLSTSTVIPMQAGIVFNFNAPVITNTVHTRFCFPTVAAMSHSASVNTISFSHSTAGTVDSVRWDFGDGSSSTQASPQHTYASGGTYTACLIAIGCNRDTVCTPITLTCPTTLAGYTAAAGSTNLSIHFADTASSRHTAWLWDFGDGSTSTLSSPAHTYASPGTYTVCLRTVTWCGDTLNRCNPVTVTCTPVTAGIQSTGANMTLSFQSAHTGPADAWFWDFGDGNTSTQPNPSHTYTNAGPVTVCLTVTNACDSSTTCTTVSPYCTPPAMDFTFSSGSLNVNLTDISQHFPTAWSWNFGDGNTSTQQNPTHTYAAPGTYTVCFRGSSNCGTDSVCVPVAVTCSPATPAFTYSGSQLQVNFTNQTAATNGAVTSWHWDFGDGNTSTQQHPQHSYALPGTYSVCLVSSSVCGSDTVCMPLTVTCTAPVSAFAHADSLIQVRFTDQSAGTTAWFWDFGDGNTSTQQHPVHSYTAPGVYTACLITSSLCGSDTLCQTFTLTCVGPAAFYGYTYTGNTYVFQDYSSQNPHAWFWDFGDGNTSTQQHPTHTYASAGTYMACLTATNLCGSNDYCETFDILLSSAVPAGETQWEVYPNPTAGPFALAGTGFADRLLHVQITDLAGRVLYETDAAVPGGNLYLLLNPGLPRGAFLLELTGASYRETRLLRME